MTNVVSIEEESSRSTTSELTAETKDLLCRSVKSRTEMIGYAWKAGHRLIELKQRLGHGKWERHVKEHFDRSTRTLSTYMTLANELPTIDSLKEILKTEAVSDLSIGKLTKILRDRKGLHVKDRKELPEQEQGVERDVITLANDRCLAWSAVGWKDGLISREERDYLISGVPHAAPWEDEKIVSRKQEIFAQLLVAVNRAIGKASPEQSWFLLSSVASLLADYSSAQEEEGGRNGTQD